VCDLCVSDHFLVMFSLPFVKPQLQFVKRTRRLWADFDIVKFEDELVATELMTTDSTDVNFLFQLYDTTLRSLLDKHAPERTVNRRLRSQTPWYDTECLLMKRKVRRLETVYCRRRLPVCYRQWRNATTVCCERNSNHSGTVEFARLTATHGNSGRHCPIY